MPEEAQGEVVAQEEQIEVETGPANETVQEEVTTLPSDSEEFTMPDKFQGKSAEDIARSYMELEKHKGVKPPPTETPEDGAEAPEEGEGSNKYLDEFYKTGELSEDSYKELEEQGVTKEQVDDKLDYERYKQQKATNEMAEVVGGIDNYSAMEKWATDTISEEDRTSFVTEFQKSGKLAREALLKNLYSDYTKANEGVDVIHTNESQYSPKKGYMSEHEFQEDLADKRYGTDRSYTKAVEQKMAKTKATW